MIITPKCSALYDRQEAEDVLVSEQAWEWLALDLERELTKTEAQLAIAMEVLERLSEYEDIEMGPSLEANVAIRALAEIKEAIGDAK